MSWAADTPTFGWAGRSETGHKIRREKKRNKERKTQWQIRKGKERRMGEAGYQNKKRMVAERSYRKEVMKEK